MSKRYKGAILSSTPPTTSASSASGVWTEQQFMQGVASGSWPALAGAPTIGTATAGALSASVTFTAPTYTGSGITGYTVTSSPGSITGTGASSPVTVSGLTAGTAYTFTVTATTAAGQSSASAASNSVTPTPPLYIEDVYSTYLYAGNDSTQTIANNIDISTKGALVWVKGRSGTYGVWDHTLITTPISNTVALSSNTTGNTFGLGASAFSPTTTGFNLNTVSAALNNNGTNYASWTFRKQPKFFDVVTYTGNGSVPRNIAHNLGSTPGCIIVKSTSSVTNWAVYHRSLGATQLIRLNRDWASESSFQSWADTSPTSTQFTVGADGSVNASGQTYVAYLFAHNAGGFGLTGTDNVISCGSFSTPAYAATVDLGYEPQWILYKKATDTGSWEIADSMRGLTVTANDAILYPNSSQAEVATQGPDPTSTGFKVDGYPIGTYIYIAIRRGPMKVPTSGTSVFNPVLGVSTAPAFRSSNFNSGIDSAINFYKPGYTGYARWSSRLAGPAVIPTSSDAAEATASFNTFDYMNGYYNLAGLDTDFGAWMFKRAPGFHDVVCYTGTGSATTQTHNLGVAPELMIVKSRSGTGTWNVYAAPLGATAALYLETTGSIDVTGRWNSTAPTSTVFSISANAAVNASGVTYVAYLFATCAGVSKVGSYTGTGALLTVNCGFAAGARFVLIKRTDSTGDWWTYDSARGISSSNDPYLLLNSTAAEVTGTNYVDTTSVGFQVTAAAPAGLNASGGTYIFLAIA